MIVSILVCCIIAFVLWVALNSATNYVAVQYDFLEAEAPNNRGGSSPLRVRFGPRSLGARHVLLSEKSLNMVSSFLVGMLPMNVAEVRVDGYSVGLSFGLFRYVKALFTGKERERVAPKLSVRVEGVRVVLKGYGSDEWDGQKEAMQLAAENMSHTQANQLTTVLDEKVARELATAAASDEDASPSMLNRLIDGIVNGVEVEVERFHLSLASEDALGSAPCAGEETTDCQRRSSVSGSDRGGGDASKPVTSHRAGCGGGKGWVLGIRFDSFRMFKKANPTEETMGVTPRALQVKGFDIYYDEAGTAIRYNVGNKSSGSSSDSSSRNSLRGSTRRGSAVVRGSDGGDITDDNVEGGGDSTRTATFARATEEKEGEDHNSMLHIASIMGTLLFPDPMCVLLGPGRQPGGNGKMMGLHFEEMSGLLVQLEPDQVFGLMTYVLPIVSMAGPYNEFHQDVVQQWHKDAFARRGGDALPHTKEALEEYGDALGDPGNGDKKEKKGDAAKLKELDKGLSLTQIMLVRMRVREWAVERPERVLVTANMLLDAIDPIQGVTAEELAESMSSGSDSEGGIDEERGQESDEEAPSLSSLPGDDMLTGAAADLPSLASGPEEEAQLESLLYCVAQTSAYADAESPVLMEVSVSMRASDLTVLIYHPVMDKSGAGDAKKKASASGEPNSLGVVVRDGDDESGDDTDDPDAQSLTRQNSGGSVVVGEDEGQMSTSDAMNRRDAMLLPALAAATTIEDFRFGFNMLMGRAPEDTPNLDESSVPPDPESAGGSMQERGAANLGIDDRPPSTPGGATNGNDDHTSTGPVAEKELDENEMPVQLHTMSETIFPHARPMRMYTSTRASQGADLRIENQGSAYVGDGIPSMGLSVTLGGLRVTDYGALETGGVLPTLVGGPAAAAATGRDGSIDDAATAASSAGGTTDATIALYGGGRLEIGLNVTSISVVALPGRMLAILDVVLACVMGPPAARKANELDQLEDDVAEEEQEEATGGGDQVLAPSARWEVLDTVRNAYLYLGRMNARFTIKVGEFALLLPQNAMDARTNILMAQCAALEVDMQSGSAFESLDMDVGCFSVAPCVQKPAASANTIKACSTLHEAAVTVALRGPLTKMLTIMREGFALVHLDLYPIPERRIILPVDMKLHYSTNVSFRSDDAPEAEANALVGELRKVNSPAGASSASSRKSEGFSPKSNDEVSSSAIVVDDQHRASGAPSPAREDTGTDDSPSDGEESSTEKAADVDKSTAEGAATKDESKDSAEDAEGESSEEKKDEEDDSQGSKKKNLLPGLYVLSEVKLHVISGLQVKVTDLDLAVLQGISTSLLASLGSGETAPTGASQASKGNASLTYALDKAQRRMVASFRQAFRRADINGDGTLDRDEVKSLLRHHLEAQNLDPAEREAEVGQFISLLDEDGTESLDIDEFTSTMMRLMTNGPDEATLERARRQALLKAFKEADADGSGTLDVMEITDLLKKSDSTRTQSEILRQVERFMAKADVDGDGEVDVKEFLELVRSIRVGNPHEGPVEPTAEEFRSWEIIKPMLEGHHSLEALISTKAPDYYPEGFWEAFEKETHATRKASEGQNIEAVQAKMVKTFDNYGFARDAWSFLVAPAWYPGIVRVGSLTVNKPGSSSGKHGSARIGPQQIPVPVRPGTLVYAQEKSSHTASTSGALTGMKIQRLPEELAPPFSGAESMASPQKDGSSIGYVTGVRIPAPGAERRHTLRGRDGSAPMELNMEVDRACTLLVCFHDDTAVTGGDASAVGPGGEAGARDSMNEGSQLKVPSWAEEMGLNRTSMKIEAVLPGEDGASPTQHVYRVYSTSVTAGRVKLGPAMEGSLPYFVLLHGGGSSSHAGSRKRRGSRMKRVSRSSSDQPAPQRRLRSYFRKETKRAVSGGARLSGGRSTSGGGGLGGSGISGSMDAKNSSINSIGSSADGEGSMRSPSSGALQTHREDSMDSSGVSQKRASIASDSGGSGGAKSAPADPNPSWQLSPQFSLGGAGRGMTALAKSADNEAGQAANTALKIATISSVSGAAGDKAGGGQADSGSDDSKQPRLRFKVALLCEHGIFVQMDDVHRLENSASEDQVASTFELALKLPAHGDNATKTAVEDVTCPTEGCDGEMIGEPGARICSRCGPAGTLSRADEREGSSGARAVESGLSATLDFEHVASSEMLGLEDSLSMKAEFGIEGRYFNPRVKRSEHFIEPWSMSINMSDPRGASTLRGKINAERHFVLNATTGLASLACSIMEMRDHTKTRYSTTSVYTELRDGAREDDDGSRLLTIENHLGLAVSVTLEEQSSGADTIPGVKGVSFRKKSTSSVADRPSLSEHSVDIDASLYTKNPREDKRDPRGGMIGDRRPELGSDGVGVAGAPQDRISLGELKIPDAKKALPTATVTVAVKGFQPIRGVPLDLLGRGTHVYKIMRVDDLQDDSSGSTTKQWRFEGLVVKFVTRPARNPSVLDLSMQLLTNVFLKNDMPRPLRVALSRKRADEPNTMIPVDAEVCVPFPILHGRELRLWRSPRALMGGEALKRALEAAEEQVNRSERDPNASSRAEQRSSEDEVDEADEVLVPITPTTFDRKAKVVERHSHDMLMNGISVERTDLAPSPGLAMHAAGDRAPALWRLYVRAPYVVQNGLACDIVVWASQPAVEEDDEAAHRSASSRFMGRSPTFPKLGRKGTRQGSLPGDDRFSSTPTRPRSSRFKKSWGSSSHGELTPQPGSRARKSKGFEDDDSSDNDSVDDESDTEIEDQEDEEDFIAHQLDTVDIANGNAIGGNPAHDNAKVLWLLKSGEEAKLEGMDMNRPLHVRVGFAPSTGTVQCSDWCKPYVLSAKHHTDRTALNKLDSTEAVFTHGARGPGGARRPEFKFGAVWEHTPGNRHIHIYTKVWVVNKTGVSLAYRSPNPNKEEDRSMAVAIRRPTDACYRTDSDSLLFSSYMAGAKKKSSGGTGSKTDNTLPLMLTCRAKKLQTMPYGMAADAIDSSMFVSQTHSMRSEQPLPTASVDGLDLDADAMWPIYFDYPAAKVKLPKEVVMPGVRRVHMYMTHEDAKVEESFMKVGKSWPYYTFVPSRDCRVFIGMDKRLMADPGPPKWLGLEGFARCTEGGAAEDVKASPQDLAPEGFVLFSRFCRGLSVVPLGLNVDADGDTSEGKDGKNAAMYFVIAVRVPEEEAAKEVDVGRVAMHRSMGKFLEFRNHHRWRLRPHFRPGHPCYNDHDDTYSVTSLPEKLQGKKLMQIVTSQGDRRMKGSNMASFQVLQNSRVLICYDDRFKDTPPKWLQARNFRLQEGMTLPAAPEGSGHGYCIFAKNVREGTEVKLGGNKAKGSKSPKRMYFCLVHAEGDQTGRISAPPAVRPTAPPSPSGDERPKSTGSSSSNDDDDEPKTSRDELDKSKRDGGVVVEAKHEQVFPFWDVETNGDLVQSSLDLDGQGRGWCEPFATDAPKTTGQAKSPAGVFGVTIEALTGAFLKTRVVTVWPRFVVRNDLGRKIGVLPTMEPPPKQGRDPGQSGTRASKEERRDARAVKRASRKMAEPVHNGASVVIYDFVDLDEYDADEEAVDEDLGYGGRDTELVNGAAPKPPPRRKLWNRITRSKEEKLPCVRLLSGKEDSGEEKDKSGDSVGSIGDVGESESFDADDSKRAVGSGAQFVELPTVAVLLESIGKDTYVWLDGGDKQDDVLVRVSCRMLSNGATIHIVLSDETPSPPLRVENRSSTQSLAYRVGGDAESNVRFLEPMRWNALHWINDDKRFVEVAVFTGEQKDLKFGALREGKRKLKDKGRKAFSKLSSGRHSDHNQKDAKAAEGDDAGSLSSSSSSSSSDDEGGFSISPFSFRSDSSKFRFDPKRKYELDDVGRLRDLVESKHRDQPEVRLQAECVRPPSSVATTVLAISDTPDNVYGKSPFFDGSLAKKEGDESGDAELEALESDAGEVLGMFARLWKGVHLEARFAGMVLNVVNSTVSGPSELAAFTVDNVELGKPSGNPRVWLTVWHFQLDDMRADSPHPIILAPKESGFNSHLTKVHENGLSAAPAMRIEVERDIKVSLMHHMSVLRSIVVVLGKVRCAVHVDFWIDVQDVVFASLNLTEPSPEMARERAVQGAQVVVGKLLQAPASDATVDRIYIGEYHQAAMEFAVDFHLGSKVLAMLSSKPPPDGEEEKDEGGFGASLAMMPLGAAGGVFWGLLSSFGSGIANASPTFNFDSYDQEHYYGSTVQAVRLVVMALAKQGIVQAYKVLGHIDILGDPLSLGKNISSGVIGFVKKTGSGQIGEGSKDLVKGVVGGTASSASKMTDALDHIVRGAGNLDGDGSSDTENRMETAKAPEHVGQGFSQGVKYFGHTLKSGVKGVVSKPMKGAKKGGAAGFMTGLGHGMVGLVAAPVSGALGAASKIAASIDATTRLLDDEPMGRRREPRHPLGAGEREDRDKLKKERKKKKAKKHPDESEDELEAVNSDEDSSDDGNGNESTSTSGRKTNEAGEVDACAEAGGMGLLLVPLTLADMRHNYPEDYLERCGETVADDTGAAATAGREEEKLEDDESDEGEDEGDGEGEGKEKKEARTEGGEHSPVEKSEGKKKSKMKKLVRWKKKSTDKSKTDTTGAE